MVDTHPLPDAHAPLDTQGDEIPEHEIHAWTLNLDCSEPSIDGFRKFLSEDEIERAGRFRLELYRNRFIRCRGSLRVIISKYLHCAPGEVHFRYGLNGKPSVDGLQFNVAHSRNVAVIAVSHCNQLGVDIEAVRWLEDFDELVARFFCPRESQLFARLPNALKPTAFFNLWTRKEALLKATGEGIAYSLDRVDVTFLPDEPPCVLSMPQEGACRDWILKEIHPAPGFIGAVATNNTATMRFFSL
jgi:4'-phosphopantetheinyl transferase